MVQAVWFDLGADRPGRLLLVVHHLVVDIVSWAVIGDDLADLGAGGEPARRPPRSRTYARRLADHAARPPTSGRSCPYWDAVLSGADRLSAGGPSTRPSTSAQRSDTLSGVLPPDATGRSSARSRRRSTPGWTTSSSPRSALAVGEWRRRAGHDSCRVPGGLERHGRDADALSGLDLSGTVGWFTALHRSDST